MWKLPSTRIPRGHRQLGPGEQITEHDLFWSLSGKFEKASLQDVGLIIQEKSGKLWIRNLGMPPIEVCMSVITESIGPIIADILLEGMDEDSSALPHFDQELIWDIASACSKWQQRLKKDMK